MLRPARLPRGFADATDLLWFLIALILLAAILLPSLSRARQQAKRAGCSMNLRGILKGFVIYGIDNSESYPMHYFEPNYSGEGARNHGVSWAETMGSSDTLKISESTSKTHSPTAGHPSRSLFLLVVGGISVPEQFICPATKDTPDDLRNYGPDAGRTGETEAAQPGRTRFDFAGYDRLSYGYQLPFGRRARPNTELDVRMILTADKGPYYAAGDAGLEGTRTRRDKLSGVALPAWSDATAAQRSGNEESRPFNSLNHNGEGQNLGFADAHADFQRRPTAGVNFDNVYTLASGTSTSLDYIIGVIPKADEAIGQLSNTDSFIVP